MNLKWIDGLIEAVPADFQLPRHPASDRETVLGDGSTALVKAMTAVEWERGQILEFIEILELTSSGTQQHTTAFVDAQNEALRRTHIRSILLEVVRLEALHEFGLPLEASVAFRTEGVVLLPEATQPSAEPPKVEEVPELMPEIRKLLDEVPADFVPALKPMQKGERLVAAMTDLDDETRRLIEAGYYFAQQGQVLSDTLEKARNEPLRPDSEFRVLDIKVKIMCAKLEAVEAVVAPRFSHEFQFEPGEVCTVRSEGVVAMPLAAVMESFLPDLGLTGIVSVIAKPTGH